RKAGRVDVAVGSAGPQGRDHFAEFAGRHALTARTNHIRRTQRAGDGAAAEGTGWRNGHADRRCEVRTEEDHNPTAESGSTEMNMGLQDAGFKAVVGERVCERVLVRANRDL